MKARCLNPTHPSFKNYGGRGITVCDAWQHSFQTFYQDMGPRPYPEATLERCDNNRGYEPANCAWKTRKEQARNTRLTTHITFHDETLPLRTLLEQFNLNDGTYHERRRYGWSEEEALTTPPQSPGSRYITFHGETLYLAQWLRRAGMKWATYYQRRKNGWSVERALTTPVRSHKPYSKVLL